MGAKKRKGFGMVADRGSQSRDSFCPLFLLSFVLLYLLTFSDGYLDEAAVGQIYLLLVGPSYHAHTALLREVFAKASETRDLRWGAALSLWPVPFLEEGVPARVLGSIKPKDIVVLARPKRRLRNAVRKQWAWSSVSPWISSCSTVTAGEFRIVQVTAFGITCVTVGGTFREAALKFFCQLFLAKRHLGQSRRSFYAAIGFDPDCWLVPFGSSQKVSKVTRARAGQGSPVSDPHQNCRLVPHRIFRRVPKVTRAK